MMTTKTSVRQPTRGRIGWGFLLPWARLMAAFTLVSTLGIEGVEGPIVTRALSAPVARVGLRVLGLLLGLAGCVAALGSAQGSSCGASWPERAGGGWPSAGPCGLGAA